MPKNTLSVAEVLNKLMDEYQLNPNSLSRELKLSQTTVRLLSIGKANVTVPIAARLSKYFGQDILYWLHLQLANDIIEAGKDKKLVNALKGISKAQKPKAGAKKPKAVGKTAKRKTLAEKRKKAAKKPGARPAKRSGKIANKRAKKRAKK